MAVVFDGFFNSKLEYERKIANTLNLGIDEVED